MFRVERTDKVSWCEDIDCVVLACDEMWAEKLARLSSNHFKKAPLKVIEMDLEKEGVLLITNKGA